MYFKNFSNINFKELNQIDFAQFIFTLNTFYSRRFYILIYMTVQI